MLLKDLTLQHYTSPSPHSVDIYDSLKDIIRIMSLYKIRHIPVTNGSQVVGIITERDINLIKSFSAFDVVFAKDIMKKNPYIARENDPLEKVAFDMSANKIGSAIVCDEKEKLVGIFTSTDALNALIEVLRGDVEIDG